MSDYIYLNHLISDDTDKYSRFEKEQMAYSYLKNASVKAKEFIPRYTDGIYYANEICDRNNDYKKNVNSLGYRSPEFSNNTTSLFAGCSHTWGVGLPYDSMWSTIVAKSIGGTYSNVGFPGMSVTRIVQNIMSYCREFGNPKNIFVLFPNIDRFVLPRTKGFLENKNHRYELLCDLQIDIDKPKYFKTPLLLEEIITEDITIWNSLQSIQILEQYCKSSGINLTWSSWQTHFNKLVNKFKNENYYYDHINMDFDFWVQEDPYDDEIFMDKECHLSLINDENKYYWNLGGDREAKHEGATPHFGAHKNIHIADAFINRHREKNG